MDDYEKYEIACKKIKEDELEAMKDEIKESKDGWIETVRRYDDPDTDIEDVWL